MKHSELKVGMEVAIGFNPFWRTRSFIVDFGWESAPYSSDSSFKKRGNGIGIATFDVRTMEWVPDVITTKSIVCTWKEHLRQLRKEK